MNVGRRMEYYGAEYGGSQILERYAHAKEQQEDTMPTNSSLTRYAFLAGVAYFCCMAIAHYFGIKVPVLFVYYDTPFYAYQDKIISFAVCAYVGLFYAASRTRSVAPIAIVVLAVTVLGLISVNLSEALAAVLKDGQSTLPYWVQTGAIAAYAVALMVFYRKDSRCQVGEMKQEAP